MKKLWWGIIILFFILILGIIFLTTNLNQKPTAYPGTEIKNCTNAEMINELKKCGPEGKTIMLDSNTCVIICKEEEKAACISAGGKWKVFPDGCADKCGGGFGKVCTLTLEESCDCGFLKCWDIKSLSCKLG